MTAVTVAAGRTGLVLRCVDLQWAVCGMPNGLIHRTLLQDIIEFDERHERSIA